MTVELQDSNENGAFLFVRQVAPSKFRIDHSSYGDSMINIGVFMYFTKFCALKHWIVSLLNYFKQSSIGYPCTPQAMSINAFDRTRINF